MAQTEIELLRRTLLGPQASREERIEALRQIVNTPDPAAARELLKEAAAFTGNQEVLEYAVRAYGYLKTPEALADLAPFLDHPRVEVVSNAMKSMVGIDPAHAVDACKILLKDGKSSVTYPVAEILARRCPRESESLFLSLAFSRRQKHRALSVFYLKQLGGDEAVPLVLEMLRRERKSGVRKLLTRLLAVKAGPQHVEALLRFQDELLAKMEDVAALVRGIGAGEAAAQDHEPAAEEGPGESPPIPVDQALEAKALRISERLAMISEEAFDGAVMVPPDPVTRTVTQDPGPLPDVPPPPAPPPVGPPVVSPRPQGGEAAGRTSRIPEENAVRIPRPRRRMSVRERASSTIKRVPLFVDSYRYGFTAAFVAVCFLVMGPSLWNRTDHISPGAAGAAKDTPLGNVGGKTRFTGELALVDAPNRVIEVETREHWLVVVFFLDLDVSASKKGEEVAVTGILERVEGPGRYVVRGHTIDPPGEDAPPRRVAR